MKILLDTDICIYAINRKRPEILARIRDYRADAGRQYGWLCTELKRSGCPIGSNDLLIAAQALSLDVTLVTNDIREFTRISGLRVEQWG